MTVVAPPSRAASRLAVGLTVLTGAAVLVAVALQMAGNGAPSYTQLLQAAAITVPGAVIATTRPRHPVGWLCLYAGTVLAVGEAARRYGYAALVVHQGGLPGGVWAVWVADRLGAVLIFALPFFLLLFPTGRLPGPRWRIAAWVVGVLGTVTFLMALFWAGPLSEAPFDGYDNPAGLVGNGGRDAWLGPFLAVTWLAPLLIGVSALAVRFRRSRGTERAQLKWVLYAAVILASAQISGLWLPDVVVEVVWVLGAVALAGAILVALTRYRLYDIDLLINRTTVYAGVTLVSLAAYLTIVAAVTSVVPAARAGGSLLATAAVALGFAPLRSRLQRLVDRRMYGDRGDPYAALTRLATTHETATTTDVLPALAETVADSLRLSWVRITADAGGRTLVAEHGTRRPLDRFRTLPLTYRGTPVGELAYEARGWSPLSGEDEQLLRDVARNAGIAVHAAAVTAELQQSREALVTAREEERRRLRRDLHDGLGPSLASLTLQLDVAQRLVTTQPQRAESILGTLAQSSRQLVDDVRRLVHALRPPALDELGLEGALRQLITGAEGGETQVELQVDGLPQSLPAAVEVAVLRIVSEALTNVLRHASATRCLINVRAHDGAVVVEVRDDGVGVPTRWSPGVGLASMRERADELGGRFQVMSEAGEGTTITVVLPWDAEGLAGRGEDQHAEVG